MQTLEPTTACSVDWLEYQPGQVFDCDVVIESDPDGGFTAYARDLPGVHTQGDTIEEVLDFARDALTATIQCYLASGDEIPWAPQRLPATEHTIRRTLIHA